MNPSTIVARRCRMMKTIRDDDQPIKTRILTAIDLLRSDRDVITEGFMWNIARNLVERGEIEAFDLAHLDRSIAELEMYP